MFGGGRKLLNTRKKQLFVNISGGGRMLCLAATLYIVFVRRPPPAHSNLICGLGDYCACRQMNAKLSPKIYLFNIFFE